MPHFAVINTKLWDALRKRLPEKSVVKVGVLAGKGGEAIHPGSSISMIELAAVHEFGSPKRGIPQRSFIRATFERDDVNKKLNALGARLAKAIVMDKMDAATALGQMGAWAAGQIKATIKNRLTTGPERQALKPETIERKGSSLPLVDTGRLINAITWLVSIGGK